MTEAEIIEVMAIGTCTSQEHWDGLDEIHRNMRRDLVRGVPAALRAHGLEVVSVEGKRETLPEPMEVWACLHHDIYLGASKYSRESALEYASDGEVYRATLTFKERLK